MRNAVEQGHRRYLVDDDLTSYSVSIFVGIIPEGIGALKSLQLLGLQNNYFTNTIPLGIWTLSNLAALYLDGNALTGTIPVEARSMQSLIDLRLRDNRMTGVLDSLGSLCKLFLSRVCIHHAKTSLIIMCFPAVEQPSCRFAILTRTPLTVQSRSPLVSCRI